MDNTVAQKRYSLGAMAFHWVIAILIILNFVGALEADELEGAEKAWAMAGHKAFGITILVLSLMRIVWRLTHRPPPPAESLKSWEVALSRVVHWLFYFLIVAVPLAGWAQHSAATGGAPVSIFQMFDFPGLPLAKDKATFGVFHEIHEILAFLMAGLLVLHILGALKHQFIDKVPSLGRMFPGRG
jgi:cytochrome b561